MMYVQRADWSIKTISKTMTQQTTSGRLD